MFNKKLLTGIVVTVFLLTLLPFYVFAENGAASTNANRQSYGNWSRTVTSYLINNNDGTFSRLEYIDGIIIVEQYDADFNYMSAIEITMELPLFGGFHSGKEYHFIVFGQKNPDEKRNVEVYRVVKYDRNWQKLGDASLSDSNTVSPFEAGSLRMAEHGDMLYIRTSHLMYKSRRDGLNHQANITFALNIPKMRITDSASAVSNISTGYVSHSFNQFILTNGNTLAAVDHGDAYPRSIVLLLYGNVAGKEKFTSQRISHVTLLDIAGRVGDNYTGATISGFETSNSSYLVAGSSINQRARNHRELKTHNIFLSVTPLNSPSNANTQLIWLTDYAENGNRTVSTPHLVKINDNRFYVLWSEGDEVKYMAVDGKGKAISDVFSFDGFLSDCKPIVANDAVIWYATNRSSPWFYFIDANDPKRQWSVMPNGYTP